MTKLVAFEPDADGATAGLDEAQVHWRLSTSQVGEVTAEVCWRPVDEAGGGDFFELVELAAGRAGMVLGDVAGSGRGATHLARRLGRRARDLLGTGASATSVLSGLDPLVQEEGPDMIATAVCALFDTAGRWVRMANAGHPPGLRVGVEGHSGFLPARQDPPLGVSSSRAGSSHHFSADDGIYLFTDGVVERHRHSIEDGLMVLAAAGRGLSGAATCASELIRRAIASLGEPEDDATVVSVRFGAHGSGKGLR